MARVPQMNLFSWREIDAKGDLQRLELVLQHLNDENFISLLEKERKNGRDDYPVRAVWNSFIAGIVYQHPSVESLIRELKRNAQLREMCGFNPLIGSQAVPSSYVYTRFMKKLTLHAEYIESVFNGLVKELQFLLPDFGQKLAGDGKAISSFAKRQNKNIQPDGRRDIDGDYGVKKYKGTKEDGSPWEKTVIWFGYRLHLIADTKYELPVAYEVTSASKGEKPEMKKLLQKTHEIHPSIIQACEYLFLDKGYDDVSIIKQLWDEYQIKPLADIRNMWKDKDETRGLPGWKNIVYDYKGTISCYCPVSYEKKEMAFGGFEKSRQTLKYCCPVKAYGISCPGYDKCPAHSGIRIPLSLERRIFTPIARSSYKWKELYKSRTAIERVNSRLDVSFGFENHTVRGLKKMKVRVGVALSVMLALAVGRCKEKRQDLMRSLVRVA